MVDTSGKVYAIGQPPEAPTVAISPLGQSLNDYAAFAAGATPPPQSPAWVEAWAREAADAILVAVSQNGAPMLMLAFGVRSHGLVRLAEFIGGTHANGNFPACRPDLQLPLPKSVRDAIAAAFHRARPDIDMVVMERLLDRFDGQPNPFRDAPLCSISPNVALACDLGGGFEAVLERHSRKRKLKKHRSQLRKFESAGGFRYIEAGSEADVRRLLDAFFAMKAHRFRQQGIADVFASADARGALTSLYLGALGQPRPPFILHGLEVGGTIRAVSGSARGGDRVICDFLAFGDDELSSSSPGDFLIFENIRTACEDGCAVFDFSVGDEFYKRQWCDIETRHFDAWIPLTAKGHAMALAGIAMAGAKRMLKENRTVWSLAKRVRALRGSAEPDRG